MKRCAFIAIIVLLCSCSTLTPTKEVVFIIVTKTPTPVLIDTITLESTEAPPATVTPVPIHTLEPTETPAATETPVTINTPESSQTPQPTKTSTLTPTPSPIPSSTPLPTAIRTPTPDLTATPLVADHTEMLLKLTTLADEESPQVRRFSGSEDAVITIEDVDPTVQPVFIAGNECGSHFAVTAYGLDGDYLDVLAFTPRAYLGQRLLITKGYSSISLVVAASCAWDIFTVDKEIAVSAYAQPGSTVQGTGAALIQFSGQGRRTIKVTNIGSDAFVVWTWTANEHKRRINETGDYNGFFQVLPGLELIEIEKAGEWTIKIE